jgi:hypothetical protein
MLVGRYRARSRHSNTKSIWKNAESLSVTRTRTEDTRCTVLVGAMMFDYMEKNEATKTSVMAKLFAFLTRNCDRTLFGLQPKKQETITIGNYMTGCWTVVEQTTTPRHLNACQFAP